MEELNAILYAIILLVAISCLTFLIGKGCDYEHAETMRRFELKIPSSQVSGVPV